MGLCSGCGNPVIDGTCACPGVVEDLKAENAKVRATVDALKVEISGRSRITEGLQRQYEAALLQVGELQKERDRYKAEADRMEKHANEGWKLANDRTRQWKDAENKIGELKLLAGSLIQRVHDLGLHQKSIQFCEEETCKAVLLRLSENRTCEHKERTVQENVATCKKCGQMILVH